MTKPDSTETNAVETITDLLQQSEDSNYTNDKPDRIDYIWEYSHNSRINYSRPALYVWSPTNISVTKFSADGNAQLEDSTVEIIIMSLDAIKSREYARDVVQFLAQYYNASDETVFQTIEPSEISDNRNEKRPNQTDHYMFLVRVEPQQYKTV